MTETREKYNPRPIEKIVYLVRHGQSIANTEPVFQDPDSPLSELGKAQAQKIAERVSNLRFESLIASPFMRAKQTAETIEKATGTKAEYSELFTECVKPSSINGKPFTDEGAEKTWRKWQESLFAHGLKVEDGENLADVLERADRALDWLAARPEKTLAVVTHGFFLRVVIARILLGNMVTGEILQRFVTSATTENTGLSVIHYRGAFEQDSRWRLWIYNDHAHLG